MTAPIPPPGPGLPLCSTPECGQPASRRFVLRIRFDGAWNLPGRVEPGIVACAAHGNVVEADRLKAHYWWVAESIGVAENAGEPLWERSAGAWLPLDGAACDRIEGDARARG